MIAIWTSIALVVAALATAMTLGWRRAAAEPVRLRRVEGPTCYPRVRR